jgi:hypothetical protein
MYNQKDFLVKNIAPLRLVCWCAEYCDAERRLRSAARFPFWPQGKSMGCEEIQPKDFLDKKIIILPLVCCEKRPPRFSMDTPLAALSSARQLLIRLSTSSNLAANARLSRAAEIRHHRPPSRRPQDSTSLSAWSSAARSLHRISSRRRGVAQDVGHHLRALGEVVTPGLVPAGLLLRLLQHLEDGAHDARHRLHRPAGPPSLAAACFELWKSRTEHMTVSSIESKTAGGHWPAEKPLHSNASVISLLPACNNLRVRKVYARWFVQLGRPSGGCAQRSGRQRQDSVQAGSEGRPAGGGGDGRTGHTVDIKYPFDICFT